MKTARKQSETTDHDHDPFVESLLLQATDFGGDTSSVRIPDRFLRLPEVIKRVGLGRASIYRLMLKGKFCTAHKLGERAVGWLEKDIQGWIQARAKASKEVS